MVYQERSLVGALSVAENVYAGRQPVNALGVIRRGPMYEGTRRILADLEVDIDPRTPVALLSPGQQQMVEIAKGLSHELKLLILDEPTSSLTINEGRHLFRVIRRLAAQGVAIIYVSHRMAEIFEISDRVTVMKDGRVTGVRDTASVTHGELISLMVGRELSFEPDPRRAAADAAVALEVRDLAAAPVVSASFSLRYGEIVCLAGLLGAGRTEVCEAIFGARPIQSGSVLVDGKELRPRSPSDSMAAGISMLPEDRKEGGLFMDFTIAANVVAANLARLYASRPAFAQPRCAQVSQKYEDDLRIATPEHRPRGAQPLGRQPAEGAARQMAGAAAAHPDRGRADARRRRRLQGRHLPHPARPRRERHGAAGRLVRPAGGAGAGASHRRHVGGPGRRRARRRRRRPRSPSSSSPRPRPRQREGGMSSDTCPRPASHPATRREARRSGRAARRCSCASPPTGSCCSSC